MVKFTQKDDERWPFQEFPAEKGFSCSFLTDYTAIPKQKSEFLEVNLDTVQLESNLP